MPTTLDEAGGLDRPAPPHYTASCAGSVLPNCEGPDAIAGQSLRRHEDCASEADRAPATFFGVREDRDWGRRDGTRRRVRAAAGRRQRVPMIAQGKLGGKNTADRFLGRENKTLPPSRLTERARRATHANNGVWTRRGAAAKGPFAGPQFRKSDPETR
jgi:hypothetical protein